MFYPTLRRPTGARPVTITTPVRLFCVRSLFTVWLSYLAAFGSRWWLFIALLLIHGGLEALALLVNTSRRAVHD